MGKRFLQENLRKEALQHIYAGGLPFIPIHSKTFSNFITPILGTLPMFCSTIT